MQQCLIGVERLLFWCEIAFHPIWGMKGEEGGKSWLRSLLILPCLQEDDLELHVRVFPSPCLRFMDFMMDQSSLIFHAGFVYFGLVFVVFNFIEG